MSKNRLLAVYFFLITGLLAAQEFNAAKMDSLFAILAEKDQFMGSIAVSANGQIIYAKAIGKDDLESGKASTTLSKYRIGSISKMFTACLILKAVEEKKISLDQTLDKYYPAIQNSSSIRISHLLNHRSGIHNFTNDPLYQTYHTKAQTEADLIGYISKGKSDFEPDSKFSYSNSNYVLLSFILEKVYRQTFKDLVFSKIAKPLGLKNTYFGSKTNLQENENYSYHFSDKWIKEPETDMSIPLGAGAIVSTPTDLTKFIEGLFANKIINEKSLSQMIHMQDNYGFGIYPIPFREKAGYGHNGGIDGFLSVLAYYPENHLAVAITSNGMIYENNEILIAALSAYYHTIFELPTFKTFPLTEALIAQYIGDYASPAFPLTISITAKGLAVYAQATGQSAFALVAKEKDKFEFPAAGIKMEFNIGDHTLMFTQAGRKFTLTKK